MVEIHSVIFFVVFASHTKLHANRPMGAINGVFGSYEKEMKAKKITCFPSSNYNPLRSNAFVSLNDFLKRQQSGAVPSIQALISRHQLRTALKIGHQFWKSSLNSHSSSLAHRLTALSRQTLLTAYNIYMNVYRHGTTQNRKKKQFTIFPCLRSNTKWLKSFFRSFMPDKFNAVFIFDVND